MRLHTFSITRANDLWGLTVSAALHGGLVLAVCRWPGFVYPRSFLAEPGRSSIALVASMAREGEDETNEQTDVEGLVEIDEPAADETRAPRDERFKPLEAVATRANVKDTVELTEVAETAALPRSVQSPVIEAQIVESSAPSVASPASEPHEGADVEQLPQLVSNPAPAYPPQALAQRRTGRVVIAALVGTDGAVLSATVHRSSGMADLDRAALDAVRGWRFTPAIRGGRAIEHTMAVPVRFVLER
ncbi:MAG TPA: energy transducer TonB [Pirellulales bacterium]|jgi:protein TonB|nr:energy transducer TonB [Pirellulales bacterium]